MDGTMTELAREIAVMKRLTHPNVVKLFEVGAAAANQVRHRGTVSHCCSVV
jgi:hypothetical protein